MNLKHFDVLVIGSGFGGSLMAMVAQRLGLATALVERGRHPRFAIGESSTPLANLLLEEIADTYDLPFLRPLSKWGTWQRELPQLGCGLKRGFTFYQHTWGKPFAPDAQHQRQLLVGASPNESVADTHWYRADVDHYFVQQAQTLGVTYWDQTELTAFCELSDGVRLAGVRLGERLEIAAQFVIDASGPRGFLQRTLALAEQPLRGMPSTQALYSQFQGVGPMPDSFALDGPAPPYPPEQAAVHHLFSGGWIWVLKLNNGITSAGVAATDTIAQDLNFGEGEPAWHRLLERLPSLREMFRNAGNVVPFVHSPKLPFQSQVISGPRWALLPSAAGFVDPLLSTGFALTLLGVTRLAALLKTDWRSTSFGCRLADYAAQTTLELETTAGLVGALYHTMSQFDLFKDLSLLYFATASYAETVRRLGKPELANGFLLCRHPTFSGQLEQICSAARQALSASETCALRRRIHEAIAPFDVASLTDPSRDPWYPAQTSDLFLHASKVGANPDEIRLMLQRCGWRASG